jgi:hypothetical protein
MGGEPLETSFNLWPALRYFPIATSAALVRNPRFQFPNQVRQTPSCCVRSMLIT